jgi:1-acyl-sn-glycerol-3-phosphate acyltransferase
VAVSPDPDPDAADDDDRGAARRGATFRIDPRRSLFYRVCRNLLVGILLVWFRPRVRHRGNVPLQGAAIIAPVHRSNLDFAFTPFLTKRKVFFMAKEELWNSRSFGRLLEVWGVFPVHRSGADRESVKRAEEVLRRGELLVMFPEGSRRFGDTVDELLEGVAFLSARTGAPIIPIGIFGSERSMPKGAKFPKPIGITVSVGEPVEPESRSAGGRVARSHVHRLTDALRTGLQAAYDDAAR